MIKRIRRRFVILIFIIMFVILASLRVVINFENYKRLTESVDEILDILAANNGKFIDKPDMLPEMSPETPFDTRFFIVEYFEDGSVEIDASKIASVDEQEAKVLADSIYQIDEEYGYVGYFRYKVVTKLDSTMIIFVNCYKQMTNLEVFIIVSFSVSIIALILFSVIIFLCSKKILAPIINSYERQNRFITNASHELKTPLTIISVNNDIIELETGESESTLAISKQVNRLTQMVNTLTKLSKIEGLNEIKKLQNIDITNLMYEIIDSIDDERKYKIKLDIEEELVYIGDKGLIEQLILVLLDNAFKYSIEYINVSCKKGLGKNKIEFTFVNDCLEEKVEGKKYLERFFRSDYARASGIEGSGIGLSIAQDIVLLHKGNIKINNENGIFVIKIGL